MVPQPQPQAGESFCTRSKYRLNNQFYHININNKLLHTFAMTGGSYNMCRNKTLRICYIFAITTDILARRAKYTARATKMYRNQKSYYVTNIIFLQIQNNRSSSKKNTDTTAMSDKKKYFFKSI